MASASTESHAIAAAPATIPGWMPILFGRGRFVRNTDRHISTDDEGNLQYILADANTFAQPLQLRQVDYWPTTDASSNLKISPVFLNVVIVTSCRDPSLITEVAYSVYDTHERIHGTCLGHQRPQHTPRFVAPGDRGRHIWRFAHTSHYVVIESADHDLASCANTNHQTTAFFNAFSKTLYIHRREIQATLEQAFEAASKWSLSAQQISQGRRRQVVLVSSSRHSALQATSWMREGRCLANWQIAGHATMRQRFGGRVGSLAEHLRAVGIQFHRNGVSLLVNAANQSALTIHLLVSVCFLSRSQEGILNQGRDLTEIPQNVGNDFTMLRVNHPPGQEPLTPAPSTLMLPRRPSQDIYISSSSRAARLTPNHLRYIQERQRWRYLGTANWRETELSRFGIQVPTVRPETL
ncbi:hypothetical protein F4780DRAFT_786584 [Xylariomycetidae sp. FL0641]|nr:hypothetical protein F4780DRAFT_786584 [Xylariomycetidae sp. FL0641]